MPISRKRAASSSARFSAFSVSVNLNRYINRQIRYHDPKFENLRVIGLVFLSFGGSSFSGADLRNTYFTNAILRSVDFSNSRRQATILTHIRWHYAQKLECARLGDSNLQDLRVREVLVTLNSNNKNLSKANFEGTNLAKAQLRGANLKGAKAIVHKESPRAETVGQNPLLTKILLANYFVP